MQKISGIIPSSPRVSAVDLKEANPVRPGVPNFGRPEGISTVRAGATPAENVPGDWRSKDENNAAMVANLSSQFFVKGRTMEGTPEVSTSSAQMHAMQPVVKSKPTGFKTDDLGFFPATSARPEIAHRNSVDPDDEPILKQPDGLFPKGFFIDREA